MTGRTTTKSPIAEIAIRSTWNNIASRNLCIRDLQWEISPYNSAPSVVKGVVNGFRFQSPPSASPTPHTFAPRTRQLYSCHLTGDSIGVPNPHSRKNHAEVFHTAKKIVLVCPSVVAFKNLSHYWQPHPAEPMHSA